MNNQLSQFKASLEKISAPYGEYYVISLKNTNPKNIILQDFKRNYAGIDAFKTKLAESTSSLNNQTNSWYVLLDNDLKMVYANNNEFIRISRQDIFITNFEEYLISNGKISGNIQDTNLSGESNYCSGIHGSGISESNYYSGMGGLRESMLQDLERIKKIMNNRQNTDADKNELNRLKNEKVKEILKNFYQIKSINEYNLIESVLGELKNHEVELNGKKYYLMEHETKKSDFETDAAEFYGRETGLEEIISALNLNYSKGFSYSCMINAESMKYEIVFNNLFAYYDFSKKEISIKPLAAVLANEIRKKTTPNNIIIPQSCSYTGMPGNVTHFPNFPPHEPLFKEPPLRC